ncbi:hypothetical protein VNO77_24576 [Canavalia gladiata]|uniref:Uncharacterized protein n=1 Tax=Canavalia gladiata TaxID=3824 RepID=A0AAN9L923_CANGL
MNNAVSCWIWTFKVQSQKQVVHAYDNVILLPSLDGHILRWTWSPRQTGTAENQFKQFINPCDRKFLTNSENYNLYIEPW